MRRSKALPEGSSDFRMQCEQSSIIFEHCPKLFELCSMSSDCVPIDPVRKQSSGWMRNAGRPENPCADCSGRYGETALAVHLRVVCAVRDGNLGHAVVEQVFRPQLGIRVDQHPVGGLPVAGMARDRVPALPYSVKAAANPLLASFSPFPPRLDLLRLTRLPSLPCNASTITPGVAFTLKSLATIG